MAWNVTDVELEPEQPITSSLLTRIRNGGVEPGTKMIARQNAAPLGWTKVTTGINDKAIRLFTGAPSDAGSLPFSTVFGRIATDSHTLSVVETPGHSHFDGTLAAATHSHGPGTFAVSNLSVANSGLSGTPVWEDFGTANTGGGASRALDSFVITSSLVNGAIAGTSATSGSIDVSGSTATSGSGVAHDHNIDLRVQYVGFCLFTKD